MSVALDVEFRTHKPRLVECVAIFAIIGSAQRSETGTLRLNEASGSHDDVVRLGATNQGGTIWQWLGKMAPISG